MFVRCHLFSFSIFNICLYNYARCQCFERVCTLQHWVMPINRVVKGHLYQHNHSPEGDSPSVFRAHEGLKSVLAVGHSKAWNERHLLRDLHLWSGREAFANIPSHLKYLLITFYSFNVVFDKISSPPKLATASLRVKPSLSVEVFLLIELKWTWPQMP